MKHSICMISYSSGGPCLPNGPLSVCTAKSVQMGPNGSVRVHLVIKLTIRGDSNTVKWGYVALI